MENNSPQPEPDFEDFEERLMIQTDPGTDGEATEERVNLSLAQKKELS